MRYILLLIAILGLSNTVLYAQVNLNDSLIAYLPMNGNGSDISGNNHNATVSSTGVYGTLDWLGTNNGAMLFNGAIENGVMDFGTSLLSNRTNFSMSFWFFPSTITGSMSLVGQDNLLETGFYTAPNRIISYHPTSGSVNINLTITAGQWQHCVITCSPTQMKTYINGTLINTQIGNYSLGANTANTRIGGNVLSQSNNTWLRGGIDEIRFYNRVITTDEINFLSSALSLTYTVGTLSPSTICAGSTLSIPFTVTGTNIDAANIFTAQLSDASGSFANPVAIGTTVGNSAATINALIPASLPSGSGYKVRIVSSLPQGIGAASTSTLTIRNTSDNFSTLSSNRKLWLKFDGNTIDSSGNNYTATATGGTSYIADRFGNANKAIQLNGTNGYVDVQDGVWFNGSPYSMSMWVRPVSYTSWARLFDFGNAQANDNVLAVLSETTTGILHIEHYIGTTSGGIANVGSLPLNRWSHLAVRYDGTTAFLYINGNLITSAIIMAPRLITRINNFIGRSNWAADAYANAAFDDFMIYDRLLTETEVRVLANDGMILANGIPCNGNVLQLDAPIIAGATYQWSGPNGFTSTQRQNTLPNVSSANSGIYSLTITISGCNAFTQTRTITIPTVTGQTAVSFTGLPTLTNTQASNYTLTGAPTGGFFTGDGISANTFQPSVAGVGTHVVIYSLPNTAGCTQTAADTVTVGTSYLLNTNMFINDCDFGFYDSGGNSGNYGANENYTRVITSATGQRLQMTFTSLGFGTGDTLFVYEGNSTSPISLLAIYVQGSNPDIVVTDDYIMTVRFKSDATSQGTGWAAQVQCLLNPVDDSSVTMSAGMRSPCSQTILDPGGTSAYSQGTWRQSFRSYYEGRLQFNRTVFDINGSNGGHWLRIYDGPNTSYPQIGAYNNFNFLPSSIQSSGEYLTFEFDASNTNAGYGDAGFAGTLTCIGTQYDTITMNNTPTTFTCGGDPDMFYDNGGPAGNYTDNQNLTKTICNSSGDKLRIDFNNVTTAFNTGDTLWAYDGNSINATLLGMYVQSSNIEPIKSTGSCLTFRFSSNASTNSRGWQGFLKCVATQTAQDTIPISSGVRSTCNAYITDGSGASAYGYGYDIQTYKSLSGQRLKFAYSLFDINGNNGGHWLRIYDGPSNTYPLIGAYNNFNFIPQSIQSSSEYLTFEFDRNNTSAGVGSAQGYEGVLTCTTSSLPVYNMTDTTITTCEGVFYDDGGNNGQYLPSTNHRETFCSDNGQLMQIVFNANETSIGSGDTLWAYDGADTTAPSLATYIAGSTIETLTSSGSCITFKWTSNATTNNQGWQAYVSCVATRPAVVNYNINTGTRYVCNGVLRDPGGTGNYVVGAGQDFTETFTSYSGQRLRATVNSHNVNSNNGGHWLRVYDGPSTASTLIGSYNNSNNWPAAFQSTGSSLTFRFEATNTSAAAAAGFQMTFSCFTGSPIDVAVLSSPVCQGATLQVPFTLNDTVYANNIYTAQLSDSLGSFTSPTNIGILTSSLDTGIINATIPLSIPPGNGYRVRVNSSQPVQLGSQSPNTVLVIRTPIAPTNISVTGGTTICSDGTDTVTLSLAAQPGMSYRWTKDNITIGANSNTLVTNQGGVYQIEISNSCDTVTAASGRTITISNPLASPNITANGATSFCTGGSVQLSVATQAGTTYQWKRGTTNVGTNTNTYIASVAGTYTVELTNICGTVVSINNITITITGSAPTAPTITVGGATTFCGGDSVQLTIPVQSGATYQWKKGNTNVGNGSNTYTATVSGTYTVVVTNNCGNVTSGNSITVTVNNAPAIPTITASGTTSFCNGGNVQLSVPTQSGITYQWKDGVNNVGANSNTFTATTAGNYTVELTNNCGTVVSSNAVTVTISGSAPITPTITAGSSTTFCSNDSVQLSIPVQSGVTYQWKNGTNNVGSNSNNYSAMVAGIYTVVVSNGCGNITSNNSITVTISGSAPSIPTITANGATNFCNGGSVQLSVPTQSGVTYQWKEGVNNVGINSNIFTTNTAGSYTVELTNNCGTVVSSNAVAVTISGSAPTTPTITASGTTTFCSSDSVQLSIPVQSGVTYQWKNGTNNVGSNSNNYSATVAGIYTVVVSNGCGNITSGNSIAVTISGSAPAIPTITANSATSFCNGGSVQLSVPIQSGVTYQWKDGVNNVGTNTNTFTVNTAGNYTVELTNNCGTVVSSNAVAVTISGSAPTTPTITASGITTFCSSDSVQLSIPVQSGVTYQWKNGTNNVGSNSNNYSATVAGTYIVVVSNGCGSITSGNGISVTVNQLPTTPVITAGGPVAFCQGGNVQLNAPNGFAAYLWSNSASTQNIIVASNGTFNVRVTNASGCTSQASNSIAVSTGNVPNTPALVASDTVCKGKPATVQVSSAATVGWFLQAIGGNQIAMGNIFTTSPIDTVTSFYAEANDNGCVSATRTAVTVQVNRNPVASIFKVTNITCNGLGNGVIDIDVNAGNAPYGFAWSNAAQTQNIIGLPTGNYSVTVHDNNGCADTLSNIPVSEPATISFSFSNNMVSCNGGNNGSIDATVNGGTMPYQYSWSNNFNTEDLVNLTAGNYTLSIIDSNNCNAVSNLVVIAEPSALVVLSTISNISCFGESNGSIVLNISGGTSPYTPVWNSGNGSNLLPGNYSVTVTDANGCYALQDSLKVTEPTPISVTGVPIAQTDIVPNGTISITTIGGIAPYQFLWSNGAITENISSLAAGIHSVTVTDSNGCIFDTVFTVGFNVGINEHTVNSAQIYPNPATDIITVMLSEAPKGKVGIIIRNVIGEIIYQTTTLTRVNTIEIKDWQQGLYFVEINLLGVNTLKKVIVMRY